MQLGKSPGAAKNMFILPGVSKGRLDGDVVVAGEKQGGSFPSVLCCYSIPQVPPPTRCGQVMSLACFRAPLRLAPMRTLDSAERGEIVRKSKRSPNDLLSRACSYIDSRGCNYGTSAGAGCPAAGPYERGNIRRALLLDRPAPPLAASALEGWSRLTELVLAGTASVHRAGLWRADLSWGNASCSSAFAVQKVKVNAHRMKVGLTSLAYMIYAVIIHAKDLAFKRDR